MEAVKVVKGKAALLDRANVDTDQIIPKQFLKSIKRTGFGPSLFFDWRYLEDGSLDPTFELNRPEFKDAVILIARNNFGCGSSREHAVWAIYQDGYRALIAPRKKTQTDEIPAFADIFRNNCGKNGLLTIELDEADVDELFVSITKEPSLNVTVDLESQTITLATEPAKSWKFDVDPALKDRLLKGLDDIGITLSHESDITAFEKKRPEFIEAPRN